ncbi:MAG: ribosome biogenesis GTPase YlqF [Lachnospiraceae bacterium]|nr:ribosome biogenesis GTPase YlqF [Lachnospiraceae bacterium]MBQ7781857.1 ribosome biogenesis GTPase YlqF [Lachnospiraceae bacterium]
MNYQWYPGHMTKAKRMMQEDIKLIDLVIELVDARIPLSSRNPDIDELGKNKSRIILLNKSDLADPAGNAAWTTYFKNKGFHVLEINARSGAGIKSINGLVQQACKEKIERDKRRGLINRPVRAMVVGIPNVGKSTFINSFAGKACTKTGNKPGVTKGKQWIRMKNSLELLDTPGILWPKFEDQEVGMKLAFIGSMNDEIVIIQELALDLIKYIAMRYPGVFEERYGIPYPTDLPEDKASVEVLTQIAEVRKCYLKGKEPDYDRAASLLVEDFRSGRLGRITLERPEGQSDEE